MFSRQNALVAALCSVLTVAALTPYLLKAASMPTSSLPVNSAFLPLDGVRAPEFPRGFSWLNTSAPLSMKELRGKIVLLDFWTYGCINCLHIIPDLKKLEAKYPGELVVIGVHSAKFDTESKPENLRQAVLRYGIEHPVVADQNMKIWNDYAVRAWPTLVLIGADGKIANTWAGEGHGDAIEKYIEFLLQKARREKILDEKPLQLALERDKIPASPLSFPGKIALWNDKIIVADSSHHRLLITDKNGKIESVIGSGQRELKNGDYRTAAFSNPQGVFVEGDTLYVADTNNHAIRRVNLRNKTVETLAGTGKQASWGDGGGPAQTSDLSSPWDVLKRGNDLFIAMAGTHQIWNLDLKTQTVSPWAGTGGEARRDGPRLAALFAQPSGLATDGQSLFVADSESSCIRAIDFASGQVKTLAGGDLFDFGDKDGRGDDVLLQHPLGLAFRDGFLYLADTYNSKIKRLNPQTGEVQTVWEGSLDEPGGLVFAAETLLVADTGSGQIRRIDLEKRQIKTLAISGLEASEAPAQTPEKQGKTVVFAPGKTAILRLEAAFPPGFKLNTAGPQKLEARLEGAAKPLKSWKNQSLRFPLQIEFKPQKSGALSVSGLIGYCTEGKGAVCKFEEVKMRIPFRVAERGAPQITRKIVLP